MVHTCCVESCKRKIFGGIKSFTFPNDQSMRQQWIDSIKILGNQEIKDSITKWARICSLHFADSSYQSKGFRFVLKQDAVPTLFTTSTDIKDSFNAEFLVTKNQNEVEYINVKRQNDCRRLSTYSQTIDSYLLSDPLSISIPHGSVSTEDIPLTTSHKTYVRQKAMLKRKNEENTSNINTDEVKKLKMKIALLNKKLQLKDVALRRYRSIFSQYKTKQFQKYLQ